jgi:Flp pilus assembly protein TadD
MIPRCSARIRNRLIGGEPPINKIVDRKKKMADLQALYGQTSEATQQGDQTRAKDLLNEVVSGKPHNAQVWLLLSTGMGEREKNDV